ncbi:hypothetical protein [Streptosporangium roseum]|uniref:hypothetical protein n=1 Tax=Streptosporangium roseum TaxID=2001 RepID=UPI0004CD9252|nr:hypothetical protein [Streptosporangium roseum]
MDLAQAQAQWDPDPGRLDTAGYGLPPRPAFENLQRIPTDWHAGRTDRKPWNTATGPTPAPHRQRDRHRRGTRRRPETAAIRAAVRAGKVRASFHPYTTVDDIDHAAEALTR